MINCKPICEHISVNSLEMAMEELAESRRVLKPATRFWRSFSDQDYQHCFCVMDRRADGSNTPVKVITVVEQEICP